MKNFNESLSLWWKLYKDKFKNPIQLPIPIVVRGYTARASTAEEKDNLLSPLFGDTYFLQFYDRWLTQNYAWLEDADYAPFLEMYRLSHRWQPQTIKQGCTLFLGAPGGGKTTLLDAEIAPLLTYDTFATHQALPLYISAPVLALLSNGATIYDALLQSIENEVLLPHLSLYLREHIQQRSCVICIDDVDRVPSSHLRKFEQILKRLSINPHCRLLLTSTFSGYEHRKTSFQNIPQVDILELLPWEDQQKKVYIQQRFLGETEKAQTLLQHLDRYIWLQNLTARPCWLQALCLLYEETGSLPEEVSTYFAALFSREQALPRGHALQEIEQAYHQANTFSDTLPSLTSYREVQDNYAQYVLLFVAMKATDLNPLLKELLKDPEHAPEMIPIAGACCAVARKAVLEETSKEYCLRLLLAYAQKVPLFPYGEAILESEYNGLWWAFYYVEWHKRWKIIHILYQLDSDPLEQRLRLLEQGKLSDAEGAALFWVAGFLKKQSLRLLALSCIEKKQQKEKALRASAIWYLGHLEVRESCDALYSLAADEKEPICVRGAALWSLVQVTKKEDRIVELLKSNLQDHHQSVSWKCINLYAIRRLQVKELALLVFHYKTNHFKVRFLHGSEDQSQRLEAERVLVQNGYQLPFQEVSEYSHWSFDEWISVQDSLLQFTSIQKILQHPQHSFWGYALHYCIRTGRQDFLDLWLQRLCISPTQQQEKIIDVLRDAQMIPVVQAGSEKQNMYQEIGDYVRPILNELALQSEGSIQRKIDTFFLAKEENVTKWMEQRRAYPPRESPSAMYKTLQPEQILALARRGEVRVLSQLREMVWNGEIEGDREVLQILFGVLGDYESLPRFFENLWEEDPFTDENRHVAVEALGIIGSGILLRWYQDGYRL